MKGCIVAAVVLVVVLILVAVNAVYIHSVSDRLTERLDALPDLPDPATTPAEVAAVRRLMEEQLAWVSLSVNYTLPDRILESLCALEEQAKRGDGYQYVSTLAVLRDLCRDLARTERFRAENLF